MVYNHVKYASCFKYDLIYKLLLYILFELGENIFKVIYVLCLPYCIKKRLLYHLVIILFMLKFIATIFSLHYTKYIQIITF